MRFHFDDDADEGGSSMRFAVKFFGQDSGTLRVMAEEAERRLQTLEGVQDLSNSFRRGRKEIQVRIDREVEAWLALRLEDRTNLNDLKQLQFGIGEGRTVMLGDIASFEIVQRPEWLIRENRKVRVAVYAAYEGDGRVDLVDAT